jgi:hypothetical protein
MNEIAGFYPIVSWQLATLFSSMVLSSSFLAGFG